MHFHSNQPYLADAVPDQSIQHQALLIRLYVEALVADEALTDQVWELWDAGVISDDLAVWAWFIVVSNVETKDMTKRCTTVRKSTF